MKTATVLGLAFLMLAKPTLGEAANPLNIDGNELLRICRSSRASDQGACSGWATITVDDLMGCLPPAFTQRSDVYLRTQDIIVHWLAAHADLRRYHAVGLARRALIDSMNTTCEPPQLEVKRP